MRKVFFSNLILLIVLNVLIKPFFILGIDAAVQNRVGAENYGDYFSLLNFSFLFNILLDIGITNYNTRNIAQSPNILKKHIGSLLGLRSVLFILYAVFTLGFGLVIGYSHNQLHLLSIFVLNQFFVGLLLYLRSNFSGLHLFKTDAFFSILDRFILIIVCSGLLWGNWLKGDFKIEWFIWAQTFSYGFAALTALFFTLKTTGVPKIAIKKNFSYAILRQSFPYALLILLMMIYNRMDAVMLERMLGDGKIASGIYAQGYRLLDAVNMFALLFAGLLLPIFSRQLKIKANIGKLLTSAGLVLMTCATIVAISCFFYAFDIIQWRYNEDIKASALTFSVLIISFIPVSITYLFGTLLTANGSLKQLNTMALIGLLINLILNYILIPHYGAFGAAIATLFTQSITALIQVILVYKLINIHPNYNATMRYVLFFGLALVEVFLIYNYFKGLQGFFLSMATTGLTSIIVGTVPVKEVMKLIIAKIR